MNQGLTSSQHLRKEMLQKSKDLEKFFDKCRKHMKFIESMIAVITSDVPAWDSNGFKEFVERNNEHRENLQAYHKIFENLKLFGENLMDSLRMEISEKLESIEKERHELHKMWNDRKTKLRNEKKLWDQSDLNNKVDVSKIVDKRKLVVEDPENANSDMFDDNFMEDSEEKEEEEEEPGNLRLVTNNEIIPEAQDYADNILPNYKCHNSVSLAEFFSENEIENSQVGDKRKRKRKNKPRPNRAKQRKLNKKKKQSQMQETEISTDYRPGDNDKWCIMTVCSLPF